MILKARQFGFSTLILALLFLDTINTPNTQTVVVAHDTDSTERLFLIVKRFYDNLPPAKRPRTKYANRREFLWPELDSYFFVGTAGSGQFGRGGTINNVHASEVAFWPNAEDLVNGLLEAVPENGCVFMETTANGLGNWYYTEYQAALRGESVFTPRFFGWHEHAEYRAKTVPGGFRRTAEETALTQAYGLDDVQLAWRRNKLQALREKFAQEYPANAHEAFLTSGNPYFDRERLNGLLTELQSAAFDPVAVMVPVRFPLLRNAAATGALRVWEPPQAQRRYVIGADTAEGIQEDGETDFDSADVLDALTWTQVAHLHGKWDTRAYGLLLAELGRWYNLALLGIERNNHGHAVIDAALYGGEYPEAREGRYGLYFHDEIDARKRPAARRPGWPTTPKTKTFALDGLATSLLQGELRPRCRETVGELLTFVKLPGGRASGEGKSHDDRVMSLAIADALLKLRPGGWAHDQDLMEWLAKR